MTPDIWILLLLFVLGAALAWFAMVHSVTRTVTADSPVTAPAPTRTVVTHTQVVRTTETTRRVAEPTEDLHDTAPAGYDPADHGQGGSHRLDRR